MEDDKVKLINVCHVIMACISIVIILASLSIYLAIIYNIPVLIHISSEVNMSINTATCFFLAGSALLIISKQNHGFISQILFEVISISILLVCSLTLYEYISGMDLGIDQFLLHYLSQSSGEPFSDRMTLITAINFIILAFTFICLSRKWLSIWVLQTCVFLVIILSLFSLFNYFYSYNSHYLYIKYTSLQAALLFIMTSIAITLKTPSAGIMGILTKDNNSGYLLRRAVPIPIILSIILLFVEKFLDARGLLNHDSIFALSQACIFFIIGITTLFASVILDHKENKIEKANIQIQQNEIIFRQFVENLDIVFFKTLPDLTQVIYASPAYEKIWGKKLESLYKNPKDWFESILPEDQKKVYQAYYIDFKKEDSSASAEYRIKREDGSIRYILSRCYRLRDENQNVFCVIGIAIDISTITLSNRYKQIDNDLLRLIETEKSIQEFSPKFLKMICLALDWTVGILWFLDESKNNLSCVDIWHQNDPLLNDLSKKSRQSTFNLGEGLPGRAWKEKQAIWISDYSSSKAFSRSDEASIAGLKNALAFPIIYQKKIFGIMEFFSHYVVNPESSLLNFMDNTGKKIGNFLARSYTTQQMHELARHDTLTKLLNRYAFEEDLDHLITDQKPKSIVVIMLDIDRFKLVNEACGYEVGDTILKLIAIRLNQVNASKINNIARLGADKFIFYISEVNKTDALNYAQLIHRLFRDPFEFDNKKITITATLGIAVYPHDGVDSESLIKNADLALAQAKDQGGNRINFFTKELPGIASKTMTMETDLHQVITNKQLILAYQPQVDLKSGRICAAEAMVRWKHPINGLIYPSEFIPFVEKIGLIVSLNEHIMRMTFQEISSLRPNIPISINISAQQFENGFHIVEYLESLIKEYSITPKQIELEITENMLTKDTEHNIAVLTAIHELDFQIAIDDFGTGFSSFNYLKRLPVHKIKIDKAFITGLPVDLPNAKIVKAIIAMVHSLDKIVVAEGAESKAEVDFLIQEKCDIVQGFYYHKPMSLDDLMALIKIFT